MWYSPETVPYILSPILYDSTHHADAATKFYIDNSIAKIQHPGSVDLTPYLKRDGSVAKTNDLNMNNFNINNVKKASSGHQAVNFTQLNDELNNYLHTSGGDLLGFTIK